MKRYLRFIAVLLICSLLAGIVQPAQVNAASKVSLNKTKATIVVGETISLKITGTTSSVTWKSSDSKVAKVSSAGKVTGVKAGSAAITATVENKKYTCNITVKAVSKDFVIKNGVLTRYKGTSKKVTIPASVKTIGQSAFANNDKLTSVTIPSSVKTIEQSAFANCDSLTSVKIPSSVTSIGSNAFANCDRLSGITIPASVKSIGRNAFKGTKWLSNMQKKNPLVVVNGILIDGTTSTGKVTVPDKVTTIGERAFYGNSKITEVTLPDSVTNILDRAFYGCTDLKSITIPASVKKIGDKVFVKCDDLTIIGPGGSYAEKYAKKEGISFVKIKADDTPEDKDTGKDKEKENSSQQGTAPSAGGGGGGSEVNTYTVRFYDGSRLVDTLYAYKNQPLGKVPSVEKTSKENAIFIGWYTDEALTQPFYSGNAVRSNMSVYGKYAEMPTENLNITSFALLDQSPDLRFEVVKTTAAETDLTEAFTLVTKDGSDIVPLKIEEGSDGSYIISAEDGFNKGSSYELTLADGYSFKDKLDTIRTVSFTIAMEEVDNLKMSDAIVYIQDTEAMTYTVPGQEGPLDVLTPSLVPETGGEFTYDGAGSLRAGDILCLYITTNPKERDYINQSYINDPEVYVEVESISGTTVRFGALDDEDVEALYEVPDNYPIIVNTLPAADTATVNISSLDLETYAMIMGAVDGTLDNAKARVNVGDFISLYTEEYKSSYSAGEGEENESQVYYGEITAYDSASGVITYKKTTKEAIETAMDLYITPEVSGDDLITAEEKLELEAQLLDQVQASSFAEDAAYLLADLATKTDGFRNANGVQELLLSDEDGNPLSEDEIALLNLGASFELTDDVKLTAEIITRGDQLHFGDGVQLAIGIDATFEVETEDEGKVAIDLSASFVEEVALGMNVNGSLVKKKILGIPIPIGVQVNSSVDIKNYTAVAFNVNVYTIAPEEQSTWDKLKDLMKDSRAGEILDQIEELQNKVDQAKEDLEQIQGYINDIENMWKSITTNENDPKAWMQTLGKTNVTKDLMDMLNLSTETGISSGKYAESMEDLMQKYSEMLQKETDWVELINKEIFSIEQCYFGIAVAVSANFIVRTDLNIAMGSSLEYEVGKRYTFWFKIGLFKPTAGSSTMDLVDERFAFQFYVMGKAGLKMGIKAKLSTGLGSTKLASVGISAELGPYVKLYGFFLYEYEKMRPANTNNWNYSQRKAGALFVDFGIYFTLGLEASALGLFEASHDLIDEEIPLLTAGEPRYRYAFAYEPQEGEQVRIVDEDSDGRNGITMTLPDSLRAVSYVDLDTGILGSEIYDYSKYNITLSNPNFSIDQNGKITVTVPDGVQYMECDLTLTWLYNKLAFSEYDMTVTIPLVWTNLSKTELNEYFTASVRVGNAIEGYQTVWSKRVKKNQLFNLPTTDEIKKLINYDSYDNGSGINMKYSDVTGYRTNETKNLMIYTDTVYDFDLSLREFVITVNDIQNADGTKSSQTYTAKYGKAFDFSNLAGTGTSIAGTSYTKFVNVTTETTINIVDKDGRPAAQVIDLTQPITGKIAVALAEGNTTATANYVDDAVTATFQFVGFNHEEVTQKLKKNTAPDTAFIEQIIDEAGVIVQDISPALAKQSASVTYIVYCIVPVSNVKKTIRFEENGGDQLPDITKNVGGLIGVLPDPVRRGYTFNGWYTDVNLTRAFEMTKMPETDITLYAKWTANTYTVTLDANGGAFEGELSSTTVTVTFGRSYGTLPTPYKIGENFAGWYTEREGGIPVSSVTIAENHTIYAHWSQLDVIDVTNLEFEGLNGHVYDGTVKTVTVVSGSVISVSGGAIGAATGSVINPDILKIQYRRSDADEWSDTAINAGLYSIKVSIDTGIYPGFAPFEKVYNDIMIIAKAQSYFLLPTAQLTGEVFGKGNITVQKLIRNVDYVGDGPVEYAAVKVNGDRLDSPIFWKWNPSNVIVDVDNNSGTSGDYVLTARIKEGENYLGSELLVYEQDGMVYSPIVDPITIEGGTAYRLDSSNGYYYWVRIKTGNVSGAGTNSNIYAGLASYDGPVYNANDWGAFHLDSSADDFERGDIGVYNLRTAGDNFNAMLPMNFQLLYQKKGLSYEWYCDWIEVLLIKRNSPLQLLGEQIGTYRIDVQKWFSFSVETYNATVQFKSEVSRVEGFDEDDRIDLTTSDHSGSYNFTFNGMVYDQFRPEGYNSLDYQYTPELSITADGYEDCIEQTGSSITIDKDKLYHKMAANDSQELEFSINLTFDDIVTSENTKVFTKKVVISRSLTE
jgi:uncharacterized repeat protein (TIGR02543 family)